MNERILLLLKEEGLTSGRLAELLGVQPSSISHLISGRNKPGFDFIASVLRRFPRIDPNWLILGEGEMYRQMASMPDFAETSDASVTDRPFPLVDTAGLEISEKIALPESPAPSHYSPEKELSLPKSIECTANQIQVAEKQIDRIVIFYTDHTFSAFTEGGF